MLLLSDLIKVRIVNVFKFKLLSVLGIRSPFDSYSLIVDCPSKRSLP